MKRTSHKGWSLAVPILTFVITLTSCTHRVSESPPHQEIDTDGPVTTHEPVTTQGPVTTHEPVTHIIDLIRPGIDDVEVSPLPSGGQQLETIRAIVLSEGLELVLRDTLVTEEPRVVLEAHSGTYVLVNATDNRWSGTLLCMRNHEQVQCSEAAGVWAIALEPGESAEMQISFRTVGPSGLADHIQLVLIAAAHSEHIGRIGGVYSTSAPDTFEEARPVTPSDVHSKRVDCNTAAVDGSTLLVRLCEEKGSLLRVLAFRDGIAMTTGSTRQPRQPNLYRLMGTGEFRLDIERQLQDAGPRPAVVLMWEGSTGSVPEVWVAIGTPSTSG